jgi:hypothetical protein
MVTGATGKKKIGRENRSTRRKPAPVPLCPPQIPHDLTPGTYILQRVDLLLCNDLETHKETSAARQQILNKNTQSLVSKAVADMLPRKRWGHNNE